MAEAAKDQDQSMEDILQSIKRIIAEEGEPSAEAAGSDVLELTELLAEDGSVSQAPKPVESISIEEIMAAPISSMPTPEPAPAPVPEIKAHAAPLPQPEPAPAPKPLVDEESLISKATLSASVSALNALRDSLTPAAPRIVTETSFRSGTTIEDLVVESLKPMLKDWLDHNLPGIVESLVKKEISKLSQS